MPRWHAQSNFQLSNDENRIDHLLQGAFEFLDVNDSAAVHKIIDEAADCHLKKILEIQQRIRSGYPIFKEFISENLHENKTKNSIDKMLSNTNP